jgi:hypothetical protein
MSINKYNFCREEITLDGIKEIIADEVNSILFELSDHFKKSESFTIRNYAHL